MASASILARQKLSQEAEAWWFFWHQPSPHNKVQKIMAGKAAGLEPLSLFLPSLAWFTVVCVRVGQHYSCWHNVPGLQQGALFSFRQLKDHYCSFSEPRKGKAFCLGQKTNQASKTHTTQSHEKPEQGAFKNACAKAELSSPWSPTHQVLDCEILKIQYPFLGTEQRIVEYAIIINHSKTIFVTVKQLSVSTCRQGHQIPLHERANRWIVNIGSCTEHFLLLMQSCKVFYQRNTLEDVAPKTFFPVESCGGHWVKNYVWFKNR